jgi:uncharacterized protein YlzI (FlbEa/FlbD family)
VYKITEKKESNPSTSVGIINPKTYITQTKIQPFIAQKDEFKNFGKPCPFGKNFKEH